MVRVGVAWALVAAMLLAVNAAGIARMQFPDPDDAMRLIQVRDLLAGQGWFDVTQTRVDAPGGGVPMHWSRIVDIPLATAIAGLTPFLGRAMAETVALVVIPLLTLLLAMLLIARVSWRLLGDKETTLTALVMALNVPIIFQLAPMRVDHHGWQLVCVAAALNGMMARSSRLGGSISGASLAIGLSISIEQLPIAAMFIGVFAWRWLQSPAHGAMAISAMVSLAATSSVLFLATRGFGDLALHCDAINPLHLVMFGWGAAVFAVLGRMGPMPLAMRLVGLAIAAGGPAAALIAMAPQCATGGGFSHLDPIVAKHWHANVLEGMPVWRQTPSTILQYAITPLIGLYATIKLASRSHDWLRRFWTNYAIILVAATAISMLVARTGAAACLVAAPPIAWQLNIWLKSVRGARETWRRVSGQLLIALALFPMLPLTLAQLAIPASAQGRSISANAPAPAAVHQRQSRCRPQANAAILGALPQGEIYAPLDIAPSLLLVSDHTVIATAHHRGNDAMAFVIETALAPAADARAALAQRGAAYVALCPDMNEAHRYMAEAPHGFIADLMNGEAPQWLEPIPSAPGTSLRLWRIRPE